MSNEFSREYEDAQGAKLHADDDLIFENEPLVSFYIDGGQVWLGPDNVQRLVADLQAWLARQAEGAGEE